MDQLPGQHDTVTELPAGLAEAYKFADLLPQQAAVAFPAARERDPAAVEQVTRWPVRSVGLHDIGPRP